MMKTVADRGSVPVEHLWHLGRLGYQIDTPASPGDYQKVTYSMTSRDPKRSRSCPLCLYSKISKNVRDRGSVPMDYE